MNGTWKTVFVTLGVVLAAVLLLGAGFFIARSVFWTTPLTAGRIGPNTWHMQAGPGGGMYGQRDDRGGSMMGPQTGPMWPWSADDTSAEPLSVGEATDAVEAYLARTGLQSLAVEEVMIFDNHAYVQVVESDTGIGAMELLVDASTLFVRPEPGPNMMWNTKYGHLGPSGQRGTGVMHAGAWRRMSPPAAPVQDPPETMGITQERAIELAGAYLARVAPDLQPADHADLFYGYYTLHTLRNGETVGMLSVNGYDGTVWLHGWHGTLLEMSGE